MNVTRKIWNDTRALLVNIILRLKGYRFLEANTEELKKEVYKIRYSIYLEEGYIENSIGIDRSWKDKYDDYSVNFLALYKNEPIGAMRLALGKNSRLPVENYFNVRGIEEKRKRSAEPSRLVVAKSYRGKKRYAMYGLGIISYRYSINNDIQFWYATVSEKLAKSFMRFGLGFCRIQENPPTEENLKSRLEIKKYFDKHKLMPFILDLNTIG